jgi:hypothetical protein
VSRAFAAACAAVAGCCGGGALAADVAPPTPVVPPFAHVVVVVFENKDAGQVNSRTAPALTSLGRRYARFLDYRGITHPSLPNYIAMVSGSTQGITTNCTACTVAAPSLADSIERSGRTWKVYAEGLPRAGWTGARRGAYVKRHVPFLYFRDVVRSPRRRLRIAPLSSLSLDRERGVLPHLVYVVPDLCHDMHDCSVSTGDRWLRAFVQPFLRLPNTVVFVLFDESDPASPGTARIPAYALGTAVRLGSVFRGRSDHYGWLRTVGEAWGLEHLGAASRARPIAGIWR